MDKDELIQEYFSGKLSSSDLELFHKFLEEDKEFKERFDFEKSVQQVIVDTERKVLKNKLQGFDSEMEVSTQRKQFPWKSLRIAASFAAFLVMGWFVYTAYFSFDTEELYASSYEKYPNTIYAITRGGDLDNSLERRAFQAYESNNDVKAVELFKQLKQNKNPEYLDFYLAQSYLNSNETAKAISLFSEIVALEKEFKTESLWYLSLTYIKTRELGKAKTSLERLIKDGSYKKTEALLLLEKLS